MPAAQVHRFLGVVTDVPLSVLFRLRALSNRTRISRRSKILCAAGLTFGASCRIDEGSIVAASELGPNIRFGTPAYGRIILGNRCSILPYSIVAAYGGEIIFGDDVAVNPFCVIYGHGGLKIGSGTRIAAGTVIVPANHEFRDVGMPIRKQPLSKAGITIGEDNWIGAGARVLDGVHTGNGCVISAGAVVTKSIPDFSIVAGVPAKVIGMRGEYGQDADAHTEHLSY